MKVLILDKISSDGLSPFLNKENVQLHHSETLPEDELVNIIHDFEAVMVRSATKITKKVIEAGKKLQIIGRAGVGVDNIDLECATKHGIYVVNSPSGNINAAAEHTVAMIFASLRQIPLVHNRLTREGTWKGPGVMGLEAKGRVLGVVGCGQVGSIVVKVMKASGMSVLVFDPYLNDERADLLGVKRVEKIEDLFAAADVVTLHIPKIKETVNLVGKDLLYRMKKGSIVVNVSRGGIVDEAALLEALESGQLRAAALDVFETEPLGPNCSLLAGGDNLILTPHIGASTEEAQLNVALEVALQIADFSEGSEPSFAVNRCNLVSRPADSDELKVVLRTVIYLAEIISQMCTDKSIKEIEVFLEGDDLLQVCSASTILAHCAVKIIRQHSDVGRINLINITQICEELCINLKARHKGSTNKKDISIRVVTGEGEVQITGTYSLRLPDTVILKTINTIDLHMTMSTELSNQSLLITMHNNNTGALGRIATAISGMEINIENCHLSRVTENKAMACFLLEGISGTFANLRKLEDINAFFYIKLNRNFFN